MTHFIIDSDMGRGLRQFGLLLWKNYTLQKRRPIATAFEIGLPTFFVLILVIIRHVINTNDNLNCTDPLNPNVNGSCNWNAFPPASFIPRNDNNASCSDFQVAFAPKFDCLIFHDSVSSYV